MSTTARITLAVMALCTILAFVSDRFLQLDPAYAATAGGLAGLFALVIVPQRIRLGWSSGTRWWAATCFIGPTPSGA